MMQGRTGEQFPFFKVGDMSTPGNDVCLRMAQHSISAHDTRVLRARICPPGAVVFAKVGAALLLNRRRLTSIPCVFDNNLMGFLPDTADARFAKYWLEQIDFGQMSNPGPVPSVNEAALRSVAFPVPPLNEQHAIANFLDHKTAAIDSLLLAHEGVRNRVAERHDALVSLAVSEGLNPGTPTKHSGDPVLGRVPRHWGVTRLAALSSHIGNGFVGPTRDILVSDGVRYLQSLHIKEGKVLFENRPYFVTEEWRSKNRRTELHSGDLVIVQTGDVGQSALITPDFDGCCCHALIIVRFKKHAGDARFFATVLQSYLGRAMLYRERTGALHPHLECGKIRELLLPVPPPTEQAAIVEAAERISSQTLSLVSKIDATIDRLREYRQAVITAAVTGRLDREEVAQCRST